MYLCRPVRPSQKTISIEVTTARSGAPVPVVNGKSLHSRYDPKDEARKFVADKIARFPSARAAIVMGMGFGYHIEALRAALPPDSVIVVFEPSADVVTAYATAIGKDIEGVQLWPTPTERDVVDAVAGIVTPALVNRLLIIGHPPSVDIDPRAHQMILDNIRSAIDQIAMSLTTGWGFGFEWIENAFRNAPRLPGLSVLSQVTGHIAAHPPAAVVIGAGPSIDDDWETIRNAGALRLAVDTALEPMAYHGIRPHLAFLFDSQSENARLVEKIDPSRINLVTTIEVQPSVFERGWNNVFVSSCGEGILSWIESRRNVSAGSLKQGGSVATAAFDCARRAGCPSIFLAGIDLAFSARQVYCRRTAYERIAAERQDRVVTVETSLFEMRRDRTERRVAGSSTQENMFNYFRWLKDEIGRTPGKVSLMRRAGLLAEFVPVDGAARIAQERVPGGFDPAMFDRKFPPNAVLTRNVVDDALAEIRRGINLFLHPAHFAGPDALERALAESGLSAILKMVVEPAIAVCRYETEKGVTGGAWLEELRDRLSRIGNINSATL